MSRLVSLSALVRTTALRRVAMLAMLFVVAESVTRVRAADPDKAPSALMASLAPVDDVAGLPRVMLLGDSISMGYTLDVRAMLAGVANVHRPPQNCNSSGYTLERLDKWLGGKKWDVIHFNCGIHDAKLPPEGKLHSEPAVYEDNLRKIVARLKQTGARLIWATCTPIPLGGKLAPDRRFADIAIYNDIAARVMRESGIPIDDLNTAITPYLDKEQIHGDVHFTPGGYKILATQVAASIREKFPAPSASGAAAPGVSYDVVVYGGTSGGVVAAVQAARMGKSVVLIEPTRRLGGLTTGGLGATDIGKKAAIGGVALEFYRRIGRKYQDDRYWTVQKRAEYTSALQGSRATEDGAMWTFEPKVALEVYSDMIRENHVEVCYGERLDLKRGVNRDGARITALVMESGRVFHGKMFVDAGYEGDVMAKAGVSYSIGREAATTYHESLAGITTKNIYPHERRDEIDAYVVKGDPRSGLLPTVKPSVGPDGAADPGIMAYCYRMCLTNYAANRLPIEKPGDYNELNYELLLRTIEAGRDSKFFGPSLMPNWKTDCNSTEPYSTNYVGMNHAYPDGDYATREQIAREHRNYQFGFLWTLQHHPRVPEAIRKEMLAWGLPKDEFEDDGHWTPQLYIREARRMVGEVVMIQQHCEGLEQAPQPIGMASYTLDSHYVQRFVNARGNVQHDGYFDRKVKPYGVAYGALVPKKAQCENLLAPVCLSASHVAYGSIRMEPVFMILGQASATAACLAIDEAVAVQDVDYAKLRERLLADKQVLPESSGPSARQ